MSPIPPPIHFIKFIVLCFGLLPIGAFGQSEGELHLEQKARQISLNKDPQKSIDSLKQVLMKKQSVNTLNLLGLCYYFLDDSAHELEVFEKSVAKYPKANFAHIYLAYLYRDLNQTENQLNSLKAMLIAFPRDSRANLEIAWYYLAKDDRKAVDYFTKMQKNKIPLSDEASFYEGLGIGLQRLKSYKESNLNFDRALSISKSPHYFLRKSVNYLHLMEPKNEIEQLEKGIALLDSSAEHDRFKQIAFFSLGKAF